MKKYIAYKLLNTATGKYWYSYDYYSKTHIFNNYGKSFKTLDIATRVFDNCYNIPEGIKVVSIETVVSEFVVDVPTLENSYINNMISSRVKSEFDLNYSLKNYQRYSVDGLLSKLCKRNEMQKTAFIVVLNPSNSKWGINFDTILEARSILRGIGVKTGTFRECNGSFAMFSLEHALNAKLLLDVSAFCNVDEIKKKIVIDKK